MASERRSERVGLAPLRWLAGLVVGAIAVAAIDALRALGPNATVIWSATGVLAGLLIRHGWREAGPMWVGALAMQWAMQPDLLQAFTSASGLLAGPALLAAYLEHSGFRADFPRREDVLRFALATAVAMVASPALATLALQAVGGNASVLDPLASWPEWWAHGTISVLLLAPAVANVSREVLWGWVLAPRPVITSLFTLAVIACLPVLIAKPVLPGIAAPVALVIVVYAMQCTDLVFGSLFTLLVTWTIIVSSGANSSADHVYGLIVAGTALLLRALFDERQRVQQAIRMAEAQHRQGILDAARQERRRIGRDMHDTVGQELTSISLLAGALERRARSEAPALAVETAAVQQACKHAAQSARVIAHRLLATPEDA